MKKLISILLCIAMLFAFTACGEEISTGGSDDTESTETVASSDIVSSDDTVSVGTESNDVTSGVESTSSTVTAKIPVKIMPLGDSLTEGANHNQCGAYRVPLLEMLDKDGVPYEFVGFHSISSGRITNGQVNHSGKGGATVISTAQENLPKCEGLDPDIVLVMLGTNDTMQGLTGETFANYYYNMVIKKLFEMYPGVTVYVATIPPLVVYGTQNLNVGDKSQTLSNPAIKEMVAERKAAGDKIELVDMSPEASGITGQDFDEDGKDTVHPKPSGNEKIATQWYNAIKDKIAEISAELNK